MGAWEETKMEPSQKEKNIIMGTAQGKDKLWKSLMDTEKNEEMDPN